MSKKPKGKVRNLVVENHSPVDLRVKVARVDIYTTQESGSTRADRKRREGRRDDFARQSARALKKAATDAGSELTETEDRSLEDTGESTHTLDETKRSEDTGSKLEVSGSVEASYKTSAAASGYGVTAEASAEVSGKVEASYALDDTGTTATEDKRVKDSSTTRLKSTGERRKGALSHARGTAEESAVSGYQRGAEARDLHVEDEHESRFQRQVEYGKKIYDDYVLVSAGSSKGFAMFDDDVQVAFVSAVTEFGKEIDSNWRTTADRIYFDGVGLSDAHPSDCQMELADFKRDATGDLLISLEDFDFGALLSDWKLTRYKEALVTEDLDDAEYWRGEKMHKRYLKSKIGMSDARCDKFHDKLIELRLAVLTLNATLRKVELGVVGADAIGEVKKWLQKRVIRKHSGVRTEVTKWIQSQPKCCAEDSVSAMADELPPCARCELKALTEDFAKMKKAQIAADIKTKTEFEAMKAQSKKEIDTVKVQSKKEIDTVKVQSKKEIDAMKAESQRERNTTQSAMETKMEVMKKAMEAAMEESEEKMSHQIAALKSKGIASFRSSAMVGRYRKWNTVEFAPTLDAMVATSEDQKDLRIGIEGVYRIIATVASGGAMNTSFAGLYINGTRKCFSYSGQYVGATLAFVGRLGVGDTIAVNISASESIHGISNWIQVEKL